MIHSGKDPRIKQERIGSATALHFKMVLSGAHATNKRTKERRNERTIERVHTSNKNDSPDWEEMVSWNGLMKLSSRVWSKRFDSRYSLSQQYSIWYITYQICIARLQHTSQTPHSSRWDRQLTSQPRENPLTVGMLNKPLASLTLLAEVVSVSTGINFSAPISHLRRFNFLPKSG